MEQPSATSGADGGRLQVRRLTDADRTAALLRREPVNPVDGGDDPEVFARALRDRTDVDRRVYELVGSTHPDRPRTVVWVALANGTPSTLAELTDDRPPTDPGTADTAVFWSIWNVDTDVDGVGTGRDLIEGAVDLLRAELPRLDTFVTLSPVPGLRRWLSRRGRPVDPTLPPDATPLLRSAATYLTSLRDDGRPVDPVARFHLGNGARLWRLNPGADRSARGMERSSGVMANYRYEPEDRVRNRDLLRAGTVATSAAIAALLDGPSV